MVWYLDSETWEMLYAERFDRKGNLWRVFEQLCLVTTGYEGVQLGHHAASYAVDVQSIHSSLFSSDLNFNVNYKPKMFSIKYLQKHGY